MDANSPVLQEAVDVFRSLSEEQCQVLEKVVELRREVRRCEEGERGKA